jgi:hypothetical protein
MKENSAFSSSGIDTITQTLDLHGSEPPAPLSGADVETFYEIERTSGEIRRHGWKRVRSLLHLRLSLLIWIMGR